MRHYNAETNPGYKISKETQKYIIENMEYLYTTNLDTSKYIRAHILSAILMFALTGVLVLFGMNAPSSLAGAGRTILIILLILYVPLILLFLFIMSNASKIYTPIVNMQNPKKERKYRWFYGIIFNDEKEEFNKWMESYLNTCEVSLNEHDYIYLDRPNYSVKDRNTELNNIKTDNTDLKTYNKDNETDFRVWTE